MKVGEIGEFSLIKLITDLIKETNRRDSPAQQKIILDIGDDAAAWKCVGQIQLATTDCLIEDVHFDMRYTGWGDLGYKSLAVNLSDIAAMGGNPLYALASLSVPGNTEVENILSLFNGMISEANKFKVSIIGGNISASEKIVINVTVQGNSQTSGFLTRTAARPDDLIAVTGHTGLSAAGRIMLKEGRIFDPDATELLRQAHLRPEARINEGKALLSAGVRAAIDISDGVISDLKHICEASRVGAIINENQLQIHPVLTKCFPQQAEKLALTGGEDYELLFTAPAEIINITRKNINVNINVIGEITADPNMKIVIIDSSGKETMLQNTGWEHFKQDVR